MWMWLCVCVFLIFAIAPIARLLRLVLIYLFIEHFNQLRLFSLLHLNVIGDEPKMKLIKLATFHLTDKREIILTLRSLIAVNIIEHGVHLKSFSCLSFAWCDWTWLTVLNCLWQAPHCIIFSIWVWRCRYRIVRDLNSLLHTLHTGILPGVFYKTKFNRKCQNQFINIESIDWSYLMSFHMHFQHSRSFKASKANFALWLFFTIGLTNPK